MFYLIYRLITRQLYGNRRVMARKHRVEVRLNSKEHQILKAYAERFGITRSEAVRRLIHQLLDGGYSL